MRVMILTLRHLRVLSNISIFLHFSLSLFFFIFLSFHLHERTHTYIRVRMVSLVCMPHKKRECGLRRFIYIRIYEYVYVSKLPPAVLIVSPFYRDANNARAFGAAE